MPETVSETVQQFCISSLISKALIESEAHLCSCDDIRHVQRHIKIDAAFWERFIEQN